MITSDRLTSLRPKTTEADQQRVDGFRLVQRCLAGETLTTLEMLRMVVFIDYWLRDDGAQLVLKPEEWETLRRAIWSAAGYLPAWRMNPE